MPAKNWSGRPENELMEIGKYYGYPDCCVGHFVKHVGTPGWNNYARGSWADGSGFIPCPECLKLPKREIIRKIKGRRAQGTAFPNEDYERCKLDLGIADHA